MQILNIHGYILPSIAKHNTLCFGRGRSILLKKLICEADGQQPVRL